MRKQIANHIFNYKKYSVDIIKPSGRVFTVTVDKADSIYHHLRCRHKMDGLVESIIKNMGYTIKTVVNAGDNVKIEFYNRLVTSIKDNNLETGSFPTLSSKWHVDIGGNADAIAKKYIRFIWGDK